MRSTGYGLLALAFAALSLNYAGPATAAGNPTISDSIFPSVIASGDTAVLQITLDNTSNNPTQGGLVFTDTLPSGLTYAGGGFTVGQGCGNSTDVTPSNAGDHGVIDFNGGIQNNKPSCTITVNVTSTTPGVYTNAIGSFSNLANLNPPTTDVALTVIADDTSAWGNCPAVGYLFQNTNPMNSDSVPSTVTEIDLGNASGHGATTTFAHSLPDYINAVGFDQQDFDHKGQFLWGWDHQTNDLVRIVYDGGGPANGNFALVHYTLNLPRPANPFNIGDITPQGIMMLADTYDTRFVKIDLTTSPPTVVYDGGRSENPTHMADWAYIDNGSVTPGLYGVGENWNDTPQNGLNRTALFYTDPDTGATQMLVPDLSMRYPTGPILSGFPVTASEPVIAYGADYTDSNGLLYMSNNKSGRIYRIYLNASDPSSATASYFSDGPASDGNDGARCSSASIDVDFGDAPDSYLTTLASGGPHDEIVDGLHIGTKNTPEFDGIPSDGADTDSNGGDDGVAIHGGNYGDNPIHMVTGTSSMVDVQVTNNTSSYARLAAWLDADGDGSFDDDTPVIVHVAPHYSGVENLQLPVLQLSAGSRTYVRVRLESLENGIDNGSDPQYYGPGTGETEDYKVLVDSLSQTYPVIGITKTSGNTVVKPDGTVNYTVVVSNGNQSDASGTVVSDATPLGLTNFTWKCTSTTGGAECPLPSSGVGDLSGAVLSTFPMNSSVTFSFTATAEHTGLPAIIHNEASATPPTGGTCSTGSSATPPCLADKDLPTDSSVTLEVLKDLPAADTGRYDAGDQFTLAVTGGSVNASATTTGSANGVQAVEVSPQTGVVGTTYHVSEAAAGSTDLADYVSTYSCIDTANSNALVADGDGTSVDITPTAAGQAIQCTFSNTPLGKDVTIVKTADESQALPGGIITYHVVVHNAGASDMSGTKVHDALPAGITGFTWTCVASSGAACPNLSGSGAIDETIAVFPSGGTVTYTVVATVEALYVPSRISNTATCDPGGASDPLCSSTVILPVSPLLTLVKQLPSGRAVAGDQFRLTVKGGTLPAGGVSAVTTGAGTAVSGYVGPLEVDSGIAYTITEAGDGATSLTGYTATWSCVGTYGATIASGIGNTGMVMIPSPSLVMPYGVAPNVVCTFTNTPNPPQVTILKTAVESQAVPGSTIDYDVVATNTGTVPADGTVVHDLLPAGITGFTWTCSVGGGAVCPSPSGSGAIDEKIATFPVGAWVSYSVVATVKATDVPSTITNTATCDPAGTTDLLCISTVILPVSPLLTLGKELPAGRAVAGDQFQLTVTGGALPGAGVDTATTTGTGTDAFGVVGPLAVDSGTGYTLTEAGAGTTALSGYSSDWFCMNAGATIASGTGITATVTIPAGLAIAPDVQCYFRNTPATAPPPIVAITKTADVTSTQPDGTVVYTITAFNRGFVDADGSVVTDPLASGLSSYTWTCQAFGGASCANPSGTNDLNETIPTFPVGSDVAYTITALVDAAPPTTIINTAQIAPPPGGLCDPGNTAPPCSADVTVTITPPALAFTGANLGCQTLVSALAALIVGGVLLTVSRLRRRRAHRAD